MAYVPKDQGRARLLMMATTIHEITSVLPSHGRDVAGKAGFLNYAQLNERDGRGKPRKIFPSEMYRHQPERKRSVRW